MSKLFNRFDGMTYIYLRWFNVIVEGKRWRIRKVYKRGGPYV